MKILTKWWPMGLIPIFLGLFYLWTGAIGRNAVLQQQIKAREKTIAVLAQQRIPQVDTVWHRNKAAAFDWAGRYQKLRDSLYMTQPTDSVNSTPILIAADSAIASCTLALRSCESSIAIRDTLIWAQDSLIADLKKKKPFLLRIGKPILPFLGGVVTGMILTR
jgi:hypothetical protein